MDLEKTLIGSDHSAQYGWRHVKRPGLDQLLERLSSYYEIVIFSENEVEVVQDLLMNIDPQSKTHKLGASAAESRDGIMLKRLDLMNRDQSRIILIDDSEKASSLFPRNTLLVKPYVDTTDQSDTALLDLIPLLQAFIHDQSTDFRDTIDDLGTYCTYIDTDINIYHPYQIMDNTVIIFYSTLPIISLPFALLYLI